MDNKNTRNGKGISTVFSRLFINSLTSDILSRLRSGILKLRLRVIGVFLSTFGIYSLLASLISHYFTSRETSDSAVYFGICIAAASIPLIIYPGNISACLIESKFGVNLCRFLGIPLESVRTEKCIGHLNAGFVAGVAAGTLTLIFSPFKIIFTLLLAVAAGVIFTMPQIGIAVSMAGLLIFDKNIHFFIIVTTLLSFIIKLARGKRSLHPKKADAVPAIFMLACAGGFAFSLYDNKTPETLWYLLVISAYFLCVFLYSDCRRITRLTTTACISASLISCVYLLGRTVSSALRFAVRDSDALLSAVNSLYVFKTGTASAILAALIPAAVGLAMRRNGTVPRSTMWLCAASMTFASAALGNAACLFAAAVATVLMLLVIGRKSVYVILSAILFIGTVFTYTGSGSRFLARAIEAVAASADTSGEFFTKLYLMNEYLLCGKGFGSAGDTASHDLYTAAADALGIVGLIIFAVFIISVILSFTKFLKKDMTSDISSGELNRFSAIRSTEDTRIGAAVPLCACISLLISGIFTNIMSEPVSFMLIWTLSGLCVSYSRSACGEIDKAKEAAYFHYSPDAAAVDIPAALQARRK